jgi:outer membrane protein
MKTHQMIRAAVVGVVLTTIGLGAAVAQDFRIGFVSSERIFREANLSKSATAKLEQEISRREKELIDIESNLKASAERLEKDAPTLSESQRNLRQRQLLDQDRDLQRKRREFQEDLAARRNEELQTVLERANKAIKQVAETEKYDVVLQEAAYISPKHDITDKVLKVLNAAK